MTETPSSRRVPVGRILSGLIAVLLITATILTVRLTRDGELIAPTGQGTVTVDGEAFENFPLPDHAAALVDEEYRSYLVEVEPGIKIHVLEVGSGYPVYLQHGAPTSGFLYRKVTDSLPQDRFRVIMPTMVGLGFSSKVPASQHTLDNHVRWMNAALEQIGVEELIFVGHDWGGPVGLGALSRSPDLTRGAVILNTVLTAPDGEISLPAPLRVANAPVVGEVVFEGFVSIFEQLPGVQADPASMPPEVVDLYARPVTESGNAKGPLAILRMTADSLDHPTVSQARETEAYVRALDVPMGIVWGTNDPLQGDRLPDMEALFPDASVTATAAGHFLQEEGDGPEAIAASIIDVHNRIEDPTGF